MQITEMESRCGVGLPWACSVAWRDWGWHKSTECSLDTPFCLICGLCLFASEHRTDFARRVIYYDFCVRMGSWEKSPRTGMRRNKRKAATMNHLKCRYFAVSSKLVTPTSSADGNENYFISAAYTLAVKQKRHWCAINTRNLFARNSIHASADV